MARRSEPEPFKENAMSLGTILLIVLLLMLVGALPAWPHSRSWGYGPTGGLGVVLIIVLVLLLMGRL
jgi:Na+/melibiose symporter-like transporter